MSVRRTLEDLGPLLTRFGASASNEKLRAIERLSRARIAAVEPLLEYHETLSFMRAFPDDPGLLAAVDREMSRFSERVARCRDRRTGALPEDLVDSGIAGTPYRYPFGLPTIRRLLAEFPASLEIDWDLYDEREEDDLASVAAPFANWIETAGLDDARFSFVDWFRGARGRRRIGALAWIVERLDSSEMPEEAKEALYDRLNLTARWDLGLAEAASRTLARIPEREIFFHAGPLRPRVSDLGLALAHPLPALRPVALARARRLIRLGVLALSTRQRELYPLAHANPLEVYETPVGRGLRIVLFGMRPDRRLPLESNYGALMVKNGVPIGYGVAAILLGELEIAVNVFPTYRRGESSFVFEQLARIFHRQFGVDRLRVERYQIGHENDEGIEAGSFWFYYKLGFRSIDPKTARLAEREADRVARTPGARTPRRRLIRLAESDMRWSPDPTRAAGMGAVDLGIIGQWVSRRIEERFGGDRARAEEESLRESLPLLGVRDWKRWTAQERITFRRWSPLIGALPGIRRWSQEERNALARVIRAKGGVREARYASLAVEHPRLRRALERLSRPSP